MTNRELEVKHREDRPRDLPEIEPLGEELIRDATRTHVFWVIEVILEPTEANWVAWQRP